MAPKACVQISKLSYLPNAVHETLRFTYGSPRHDPDLYRLKPPASSSENGVFPNFGKEESGRLNQLYA